MSLSNILGAAAQQEKPTPATPAPTRPSNLSSPLANLSSGPSSVGQLSPIQKESAHPFQQNFALQPLVKGATTALGAVGSALARPESSLVNLTNAAVYGLEGKGSKALDSLKSAATTWAPGAHQMTWSEFASQHGVKLPWYLGTAVDILGDPTLPVGVGAIGAHVGEDLLKSATEAERIGAGVNDSRDIISQAIKATHDPSAHAFPDLPSHPALPKEQNLAEVMSTHAATVADAEKAAREGSPLGLRLTYGFGKAKGGVNVPLLSRDASEHIRGPKDIVSGKIQQRFASKYAGRLHQGTARAIQINDQLIRGKVTQLDHELVDSIGDRKITKDLINELNQKRIQGIEKIEEDARRGLQRALINKYGDVVRPGQIPEGHVPVNFPKLGTSDLHRDILANSTSPEREAAQKAVDDAQRELNNLKRVKQGMGRMQTHSIDRQIADQTEKLRGAKNDLNNLAKDENRVPKVTLPHDVAETYKSLVHQQSIVPTGSPEFKDALEGLQSLKQKLTKGVLKSGELAGDHKIRSLVSYWKQLHLLSPAYDIRNAKDEAWLAAQYGVNPVSAAYRGARLAKGTGLVGGKSDLTNAMARDLRDYLGVSQSGQIAGDFDRRMGNILSRKIGGKLHAARIGRENVQRGGTFATMLRRGDSPLIAARKARDIHFDYADPGTAVEKLRTSFTAPFATWLAKNLPRQARFILQHPGKMEAYSRALSGLQTGAGMPPLGILAPWQQSEQPVAVPGLGWLNYRNPTVDINDYLDPTTSRTLENDINISPVAGIVPQIMAGLGANLGPLSASSTQKAISNPIEQGALGLIGQTNPGVIGGGQGVDVPTSTTNRATDALFQFLLPSFSSLASKPLQANDVSAANLPDQIASALTNANIQPFNAPSDYKQKYISILGEISALKKQATRIGIGMSTNPAMAPQLNDVINQITQKANELTTLQKLASQHGVNISG